jgi:hypothetical protein
LLTRTKNLTQGLEIMAEIPGVYRRRVLITAATGMVCADLEDDPHRFGVDVRHDGTRVTEVAGRALRAPFTTCAAAAAVLQQLEGTPLLRSPYAVLRQVNLGEHCTHLLDMAGLAISAAARGIQRRSYDVEIKLVRDGGKLTRTGIMTRDNQLIASWVVEAGLVVQPDRFAGLQIRRGASWSAAMAGDEDELEGIFVMERAMLASNSRLNSESSNASAYSRMRNACFSFQTMRVATAVRIRGNTIDFTDRPNALLADLEKPPHTTERR